MEITTIQLKEIVEKYKEDKTSLKMCEADVLKVLIDYILDLNEDDSFYGDLLEDTINELNIKENIKYDDSMSEVTLNKILKTVDELEIEQKSKKKHKPIKRVISILVAAIIILGVFTTIVCVANKVTPFNNFFDDKPLEKVYTDNNRYYTDLDQLIKDYPMFKVPTYIPTGYELDTARVCDLAPDMIDLGLNYYTSSGDRILITEQYVYENSTMAMKTRFSIDENSLEYETINSTQCTFYTNVDMTGVIWDNGKDIQYVIGTTLSREELEKIVKTMLNN